MADAERGAYFVHWCKVYAIIQGVALKVSIVVRDNLESFCVDRYKTFFGIPRTVRPWISLSYDVDCNGGSPCHCRNSFTASIDYLEVVRSVPRQCFESFMFEEPRMPWLHHSNNFIATLYNLCTHHWRWAPKTLARLCGQSGNSPRLKSTVPTGVLALFFIQLWLDSLQATALQRDRTRASDRQVLAQLAINIRISEARISREPTGAVSCIQHALYPKRLSVSLEANIQLNCYLRHVLIF